jgi:hypothetical protein
MKKYFLIFLMLSVACKKEAIPDPESAVLLSPENNNNCNTAIRISDLQSQVNFSWEEALHTDEYELVIRDVLTNVDQKKETLRLFASVVLDRGRQYAWWVNTKSEQVETVSKSEVWSFYLEGLQTSSHFPFPAKLLSPENNSQVGLVDGELTLRWEVDPDELSLIAENLTSVSISVTLNANQYYYWKVVTIDREGNISHSPVEVFKTSP